MPTLLTASFEARRSTPLPPHCPRTLAGRARLRLHDDCLAAGEGALVPAREREDVGERALRHVGVQRLLAPVHVEREPRRGDGAAAELALTVVGQRRRQTLKRILVKVVGRHRAVQRVLLRHVPVIPYETHRMSLLTNMGLSGKIEDDQLGGLL
eukprot:6185507-Pleurochrysis_carterae.AAC.2